MNNITKSVSNRHTIIRNGGFIAGQHAPGFRQAGRIAVLEAFGALDASNTYDYIAFMARASHREKILTVGMEVVHAHGFGGASVRDIVQAAGVPQGSFTNHFASKESFGLEVIDLYFANTRKTMDQTLRNDDLPPLRRLRAYLDASRDRLEKNDMRNGCLLGNFVAEASGWSEPIRLRLNEIFTEIQDAVAYCLHSAMTDGELDPRIDCEEMAAFIVSSLQGAILLAKSQHSPVPVERFRDLLFATILPRVSAAQTGS